MIHQFHNEQTNALFRLVYDEPVLDRIFYGRDHNDKLLTIAWNRGPDQVIKIDNIEYNFLVETHFRTQHQVKFYADQLFKSPKTLSNLFGLYNHKTPLFIIQDRVIMEAKRMMFYTDKTAKEIAYELGFDDAGTFGKFFKRHTGVSASDFRKLNVAGG